MSKVKLDLHELKRSRVEVDGQDIVNGVRSLVVEASAGNVPTVTVNLVAIEGVEVEGEARVYLSAHSVRLLAEFGWWPPEDAHINDDGSVWLVKPAVEDAVQQAEDSTDG